MALEPVAFVVVLFAVTICVIAPHPHVKAHQHRVGMLHTFTNFKLRPEAQINAQSCPQMRWLT